MNITAALLLMLHFTAVDFMVELIFLIKSTHLEMHGFNGEEACGQL